MLVLMLYFIIDQEITSKIPKDLSYLLVTIIIVFTFVLNDRKMRYSYLHRNMFWLINVL